MSQIRLMTRKEFAQALKISRRSTERYQRLGLFAPVAIGKRGAKLFNRPDVRRVKKDLAKVWRKSPPVWRTPVGDGVAKGGQ